MKQQLRELLETAANRTTFDMGRQEFRSDAIRSSFAARPGEVIDSDRFGGIASTDNWNDDFVAAERARPMVPDEPYSKLNEFLRCLLAEYIDPDSDRVGHAFPVNGKNSYGSHSHGSLWLTRSAFVSELGELSYALVRAAAVLGAKKVSDLVSGWVQGRPVEYRSCGLINGLYIDVPVGPLDGVYISPLPRSTDKLPGSLPRIAGLSKRNYIGRTVASLSTCAQPAFFHPDYLEGDSGVEVVTTSGVGFPQLFKALSLVENTHVERGFFWNDYLDQSAFCLSPSQNTWSFPNSGYSKSLPLGASWRFDHVTDVQTLVLPEGSISSINPLELRDTLKAVASVDSRELNLAIERWSRSKKSRSNLEDSFIDLRIALEALYLKDFTNEYSQEMRFRLSLFGAWHLGADLEERQTIRKALRDAYDRASGVVHGGDLEDNESSRELLSAAQDLCRQGILKLIREGMPSSEEWGNLILGSELAGH